VAGLAAQTVPSTACSVPIKIEGNRRPVGYGEPSKFRSRGPTAPMRSSAVAVATMWASDPAASRASGLTTSSHGAAVCAAPRLIARDSPRLAGCSNTFSPRERAISALWSREALSTTTTSSGCGPAAAGSASRQLGKSAALW